MDAWQDFLGNSILSCNSSEGGAIGRAPLPITTKLAFHWGCLGSKIKHPAGNQAAQDGHISHNNGYVILDMIDAVVDWVCPIRLEKTVETVAI